MNIDHLRIADSTVECYFLPAEVTLSNVSIHWHHLLMSYPDLHTIDGSSLVYFDSSVIALMLEILRRCPHAKKVSVLRAPPLLLRLIQAYQMTALFFVD